MAATISANGKTTLSKAMGGWSVPIKPSMKANGLMMSSMVKVARSGTTESSKDSTRMVSVMVRANSKCLTALHMRAPLSTIKWKDKESTHGPMAATMSETLKTTRCTDRDSLCMAMVAVTKAVSSTIRKRATESFPGKYISETSYAIFRKRRQTYIYYGYVSFFVN